MYFLVAFFVLFITIQFDSELDAADANRSAFDHGDVHFGFAHRLVLVPVHCILSRAIAPARRAPWPHSRLLDARREASLLSKFALLDARRGGPDSGQHTTMTPQFQAQPQLAAAFRASFSSVGETLRMYVPKTLTLW